MARTTNSTQSQFSHSGLRTLHHSDLAPWFDICLIIAWVEAGEDLSCIPAGVVLIHEQSGNALWYATAAAPFPGKDSSRFAQVFSQIIEACLPRGRGYRVFPQFCASGAFVLSGVPADADPVGWNKPCWAGQHPLWISLLLSRLIRPTPTGLRFVARCRLEKGELETVIPAPFYGWATEAYYLPVPEEEGNAARTWFDREELRGLGELLARYLTDPEGSLPKRLLPALNFYTRGFSCNDLTSRWTFVTQALQSIVCTDQRNTGSQFKKRLLKLADRLNIEISEPEINMIWKEKRCSVAHGGVIRPPAWDHRSEAEEQELRLLCKAEAVIRGTLKATLLERGFADLWGDANAIRRLMPIRTQSVD